MAVWWFTNRKFGYYRNGFSFILVYEFAAAQRLTHQLAQRVCRYSINSIERGNRY